MIILKKPEQNVLWRLGLDVPYWKDSCKNVSGVFCVEAFRILSRYKRTPVTVEKIISAKQLE